VFPVRFELDLCNLENNLRLYLHKRLPTSDNPTTATFADDTAILTAQEDPAIAPKQFEATIDAWAKKWRTKNQSKSLRNQTYPTVQMSPVDLPQKNEVKYLGMHLGRRLTWEKHIETRRKQFNLKEKYVYALATRKKINTINRKQTASIQSST
jgi:hypothetical protein